MDSTATPPTAPRERVLLTTLAVAAIATLGILLFERGVPILGDLYLGVPISIATAFPDLYSPDDLLVAAGVRGPFHFYKSAGWFFANGWPADLIWHAGLAVVLFGYFAAVFALAHRITGDLRSAAVATMAAALCPVFRGTLHWSSSPLLMLVPATVGIPLGIVAFLLWFAGWEKTAVAVAAGVANIHPYVGAIAFFIISALILTADSEVPRARRLLWCLGGMMAAVPNAIYVLVNVPLLRASGADPADIYAQLRIHAYHAFVDDHWHEGYGWYFLSLAVLAYFARALAPRTRRAVLTTAAAITALFLLMVFNAYVVKWITLLLAYLVRATYFYKPIVFAVLAHGLARWWWTAREASPRTFWWRAAVTACFALSVVDPVHLRADAEMLIGTGLLLATVATRPAARWFGAGAAVGGVIQGCVVVFTFTPPDLPPLQDGLLAAFVVLDIVLAVPLGVLLHRAAAPAGNATPVPPRPAGRVLLLAGILLLGARVVQMRHHGLKALRPRSPKRQLAQAKFLTPPPFLAGVAGWVERDAPPGALFACPPVDHRFHPFRLAARRGSYVHVHDINQLAFDPGVYLTAGARIERLGVRTLGRHRFDETGYYRLTAAQLRALHTEERVRYFVLARDGGDPAVPEHVTAYVDEHVRVLDLSRLP